MKTILTFIILLSAAVANAKGNPSADDNDNVFGQAAWIGNTAGSHSIQDSRSIWLRKSFTCPKPIKKATLCISGLGFYELYVNYRKIGDDVLSPAVSDYNKTVFYNTIDMTPYLKCKRERNGLIAGVTNVLDKMRTDSSMQAVTAERKRNELKDMSNLVYVLLGNGYYNENGSRYHPFTTHFGPETMIFHLVIEYNDGTRQTIDSDNSWFVQFSPVVYNSLFGGEDYDARLESPTASQETGISVSPWHPAMVQPAPKGVLRRQLTAPCRVVATWPVARKLRNNVFDMGQNVGGFPQITFNGKRGQSVKIIVGETLDMGHVSQTATGSTHTYLYILRGNGRSVFVDESARENGSGHREIFHPHFSYYGFRYIEVQGAVTKDELNPSGLPVIEDIQSCMVSNGADMTGSFECSNPLFNNIYKVIGNAVRSNWTSLLTDTPHSGKTQMLERLWLNAPGLMYNFDMRHMIEQTMINIADAQHADGSVPDMAPDFSNGMLGGSAWQESPEWGGAIVALPYMYKDFYGSDSLINAYMPQMKRYVSYLSSKAVNGIIENGIGDRYDYVPGKAQGETANTPAALMATAHYYKWAELTGMKELAAQIKNAFLARFKPASQAAWAVCLDMGLYPDGQKQAYLDSLVSNIKQHHNRLSTGEIGTYYLFKVLIDNNKEQLLYAMLNHHDAPGYGYAIVQGNTTLTEQWLPDRGGTRNSFMMAHINNHLIKDMAGINIHAGSITIDPRIPDGLTYAKATTACTLGPVSASWEIKGQKMSIDVKAPEKSRVTFNRQRLDEFCKQRGLELSCQVNGKKQ